MTIKISSVDDALNAMRTHPYPLALKIAINMLEARRYHDDIVMEALRICVKHDQPKKAWDILHLACVIGDMDKLEFYFNQLHLLFPFNDLDRTYREALQRKDAFPFVYCLYGEYLNKHYRGGEAIKYFAKPLQEMPDNLRLLLGYISALEQADKRDEARHIFNRILPWLNGDGNISDNANNSGDLTQTERAHLARAWCDFIGREGDTITAIQYLHVWFEEWQTQTIAKCQDIGTNAQYWHEDIYHNDFNKEIYKDKTIALFGLAGHGDAIQFLRFAQNMKQIFKQVHLYVKPGLVKLFRASSLGDKVFKYDKVANVSGNFDYFNSNFNMVDIYQAHHDNITQETAYLQPTKTAIAQWKKYIQKCDIDHDKPKISLCWSGDTGNPMHIMRRLFLNDFIPLLKNNDVVFFNAQKNVNLPQRQILEQYDVVDLSQHFDDFNEAAAMLVQMDAVICCDTAINHLAGALGIKTYCLISHFPEFRWQLPAHHRNSLLAKFKNDQRFFRDGYEYSPWYKDMMLIRQSVPYQWHNEIALLEKLLQK